METKNRQKFLLIAAGIGVFLWVADSFIFSPLVDSWHSREDRIAELSQRVDNGEALLKVGPAINRQWDRMRTNALPGSVSIAEAQMLKSFDRWERAAGITRVSIKPTWKQSEEDSYMTVEYRADYTGDIERLKSFLFQVEKDPLGLKVDNIEISSRDDSGSQLSMGLQVSGLVLNPEQSALQP